MNDPRHVTAEGVAALNAHDEHRLRAVYAEGAVLEAPGPARLEGADQDHQHRQGFECECDDFGNGAECFFHGPVVLRRR